MFGHLHSQNFQSTFNFCEFISASIKIRVFHQFFWENKYYSWLSFDGYINFYWKVKNWTPQIDVIDGKFSL